MKKKIVSVETSSGFTCKVDADKFDDYEFTRIMTLEDGVADAAAVVFVVEKILDKNDADRLKEHCRDKNTGRVRSTLISQEAVEIIQKAGEASTAVKN